MTNVVAQLIRIGMHDPEFREALREDPRAAVRQYVGPEWEIPDDVEVSVHQQDSRHLHIVLPATPRPAPEQPMAEETLQGLLSQARD